MTRVPRIRDGATQGDVTNPAGWLYLKCNTVSQLRNAGVLHPRYYLDHRPRRRARHPHPRVHLQPPMPAHTLKPSLPHWPRSARP